MGLDQFNQSPQNVKNLGKVTASEYSFQKHLPLPLPTTSRLGVKEMLRRVLGPHAPQPRAPGLGRPQRQRRNTQH